MADPTPRDRIAAAERISRDLLDSGLVSQEHPFLYRAIASAFVNAGWMPFPVLAAEATTGVQTNNHAWMLSNDMLAGLELYLTGDWVDPQTVMEWIMDEIEAHEETALAPEPAAWVIQASNDALISTALELLEEECKSMSPAGLNLLRQYAYANAITEREARIAAISEKANRSKKAERKKVIDYLARTNVPAVSPDDLADDQRKDLARILTPFKLIHVEGGYFASPGIFRSEYADRIINAILAAGWRPVAVLPVEPKPLTREEQLLMDIFTAPEEQTQPEFDQDPTHYPKDGE